MLNKAAKLNYGSFFLKLTLVVSLKVLLFLSYILNTYNFTPYQMNKSVMI
jgi:hypothetical protein